MAGFNGFGRGASSMTAAASTRLRGISFLLIVAQQFAGCLVDEVGPGTCRAGHGLVGIRIICWRGVWHLNLNIHAGPRAAKYQLAHLLILLWQEIFALILLKAIVGRGIVPRRVRMVLGPEAFGYGSGGLWIGRRAEFGDQRLVGRRRRKIA
jgi:hypothetical protein